MFRLLFLLCILSFEKLYAQSPPLEHSVFWKIEHDSIHEPVYLYGTIHEICLEKMFWSPILDSVIKSSDEVIFEIDMVKYFKEYIQVDFDDFVSYRDSLKVALKVAEWDTVCSGKISYEQAFMMLAVKEKKRLGYLESAITQFWALYKYQAYATKSNRRNKDNSDIMTLQNLYITQNIDSLYEWLSSMTNKEQMRALLINRNIKWVKKMNNYLFSSSTKKLFVVGAGHLPGEQGLINLLRMSGFRVSPVFLRTI